MKTRSSRRFPRALVPAVGALAIVTAGSLAAASPSKHGPHGPNMSSMLESRVEKLDLDEATRNAVYAIIDGSKSTERETKTRLRNEHESLRTLLKQESPDETAVLEHADRIGALMTELRKQQLRTLLAVRAQLTPEQREALRPPDGEHRGCSDKHDTKVEH